jgi:NAD(P)-dependent dehydrogenase (short-subunit alcohol dehydrogenase family)
MPDSRSLLDGRRILVVGASSGIGRAIAIAAAGAGAEVVLAARRVALLQEVAEQAGPRAWPVVLDVRTPLGCRSAVHAAVERLGRLDALVYAAGINRLAMLSDTELEAWRDLLDTNLVGAALVTAAALPALVESGGRALYLSSHSVGRPWPGLGAYAASKAGLDTMVAAWRGEVPEVHFGRAVVGPTLTGMADSWDADLAAAMFGWWEEAGYLDRAPAPAEEVAERVIAWVGDPEPCDDLWLTEPTS